MRLLATLLAAWAVCSATAAQRLSAYAERLDQLLVQPQQFQPLPRADQPFWRDSLPAELRRGYIAYGERELGQPWTVLPLTAFAEFKASGNRTHYERLCFERRRRLAVLVMAEVVEGCGRFLPDVADGLACMLEEPWWGIPAHYGKAMPQREEQTVDLFNAETAGLLAWAVYMLRPQLEARWPLLVSQMDGELRRRLLEPARRGKYWWKTAGMNWNPWICSNWLACVLLAETDRQRQLDAVTQILSATDTFIDAYKDDGGCDEGPGYWDRAAASMYEVLWLLRQATGGAIDLSRDPKVQAMGSYVYKTYIQNGYCTTFADMHTNKAVMQPNILYPFGRFLGDGVMTRYAAYAAYRLGYPAEAGRRFSESHNFPSLARELPFLYAYASLQREQPAEPLLDDAWLPDLQVMTARRGRLYVAMKGGHNDESHNHNDVGSFVVYADGQPLIVDVGVGEYTSKTFSKDRYTIWTMQSQYHNLPQVNGCDQQAGRQYAATVVSHRRGQLCLELAAAYPAEAGVKSWRRTLTASARGVAVSEDYELERCQQAPRLTLMTTTQPTIAADRVTLGEHCVEFDGGRLTASVEDVAPLMDQLLQGVWGPRLYRVVLTVKGRQPRQKITYTIK